MIVDMMNCSPGRHYAVTGRVLACWQNPPGFAISSERDQ